MIYEGRQATTINWKSDSKNLVKLYPRRLNGDDEDEVQDTGSFFNWFTTADDDFAVSGSRLKRV